MPDYSVNDPKGWCGDPSRGAALGRRSVIPETPEKFSGKLSVSRVRLYGDYDKNGTYFGSGGLPIYWIASEDCEVDMTSRARNRDHAVAIALAKFPLAKIRGAKS